MSRKRALKDRYQDFMYDHLVLKYAVEYGFSFLVMVASAFLFAIGFKCFLSPSVPVIEGVGPQTLVSGGISGVSQTIILFVNLVSGGALEERSAYDLTYSILYLTINIPVFILAWKGVGKRFAVLTLVNVLSVSLFTNFMNFPGFNSFVNSIAEFVATHGGLLGRALFAGVCTGVSSAIAFKMDASAGGIDVVAYYIALKKSTLVGKYSVFLNAGVLLTFSLLSTFYTGNAGASWGGALFTAVYLIVCMIVMDMINLRNKKVQLEIVTEEEGLANLLMANIPHGATITKGKGAFSGKDKTIITTVISSYEEKKTVEIIRKADPKAFIKIVELKQVFGNFFSSPIK